MHIVVAFPLVAAIVTARLVRFDHRMEEAARDLGATNREVLRYIMLPHLVPALAAAAILAFSYSFNNFVISFFVGGFELTFPIWVFSTLRHAQNVPIVNAISTLVSLAQLLIVVRGVAAVASPLEEDGRQTTTRWTCCGSGRAPGRAVHRGHHAHARRAGGPVRSTPSRPPWCCWRCSSDRCSSCCTYSFQQASLARHRRLDVRQLHLDPHRPHVRQGRC